MSLVEKTFNQGEVIIKEGDIGKTFFRLLEGKAGVYADYGKNDPMRLAVLETGEYFGEMAIIEEYPRSATVVAIGRVKVVEIPENGLNDYFKKNPDQIIELIRHLGRRIQSMNTDFKDAKALLKQVRESEEGKKKSLFSKIKKHIDLYQQNKNKISEADTSVFNEAFADLMNDDTGRTETYTKGKIFYKEGEVGTGLYLLKKGQVGMYTNFRKKEEIKLSDVNAVSVFGEMGLLSEDPREATAVAEIDDTRVELIYQEDVIDIFNACPMKIDLILRYLSFTLRKLTNDFLCTCKDITETYNNK